MSVVEELADALARDTIEAADKLGDDRLIEEVAKVIGSRSTTTEEAFMTAIRVRLAAAQGRRYLEERLAKAGKAEKPQG